MSQNKTPYTFPREIREYYTDAYDKYQKNDTNPKILLKDFIAEKRKEIAKVITPYISPKTGGIDWIELAKKLREQGDIPKYFPLSTLQKLVQHSSDGSINLETMIFDFPENTTLQNPQILETAIPKTDHLISSQSDQKYGFVAEWLSNAIDASDTQKQIGRFGEGFFQSLSQLSDAGSEIEISSKKHGKAGYKILLESRSGDIVIASEKSGQKHSGTSVQLKREVSKDTMSQMQEESKQIEEFIVSKFRTNTRAKIMCNGKRLNTISEYHYLNGGKFSEEGLPEVHIDISPEYIKVTDTGIGMCADGISKNLLYPNTTSKERRKMTDEEVMKLSPNETRFFYKNKQGKQSKTHILLQVAGVVIEDFHVESVGSIGECVFEFPSFSPLEDSRNEIKVGRETTISLVSALEKIANTSSNTKEKLALLEIISNIYSHLRDRPSNIVDEAFTLTSNMKKTFHKIQSDIESDGITVLPGDPKIVDAFGLRDDVFYIAPEFVDFVPENIPKTQEITESILSKATYNHIKSYRFFEAPFDTNSTHDYLVFEGAVYINSDLLKAKSGKKQDDIIHALNTSINLNTSYELNNEKVFYGRIPSSSEGKITRVTPKKKQKRVGISPPIKSISSINIKELQGTNRKLSRQQLEDLEEEKEELIQQQVEYIIDWYENFCNTYQEKIEIREIFPWEDIRDSVQYAIKEFNTPLEDIQFYIQIGSILGEGTCHLYIGSGNVASLKIPKKEKFQELIGSVLDFVDSKSSNITKPTIKFLKRIYSHMYITSSPEHLQLAHRYSQTLFKILDSEPHFIIEIMERFKKDNGFKIFKEIIDAKLLAGKKKVSKIRETPKLQSFPLGKFEGDEHEGMMITINAILNHADKVPEFTEKILNDESIDFLEYMDVMTLGSLKSKMDLSRVKEILRDFFLEERCEKQENLDKNYSIYTKEFDEEIHASDLNDVNPESVQKLAGLISQESITQCRISLENYKKKSLERHSYIPPISFIIDNSGSLRGRPAIFLWGFLKEISPILEELNIPFEVLGYTTKTWKGGKSREKWLQQGKQDAPGRLCDIRHVIFKSFSESYSDVSEGYDLLLKKGYLKENIDGEAIQWAYKRLGEHSKSKYRNLIHISDGAPHDDSTLSLNPDNFLQNHLQNVIKSIAKEDNMSISSIYLGYEGEIPDFYTYLPYNSHQFLNHNGDSIENFAYAINSTLSYNEGRSENTIEEKSEKDKSIIDQKWTEYYIDSFLSKENKEIYWQYLRDQYHLTGSAAKNMESPVYKALIMNKGDFNIKFLLQLREYSILLAYAREHPQYTENINIQLSRFNTLLIEKIESILYKIFDDTDLDIDFLNCMEYFSLENDLVGSISTDSISERINDIIQYNITDIEEILPEFLQENTPDPLWDEYHKNSFLNPENKEKTSLFFDYVATSTNGPVSGHCPEYYKTEFEKSFGYTFDTSFSNFGYLDDIISILKKKLLSGQDIQDLKNKYQELSVLYKEQETITSRLEDTTDVRQLAEWQVGKDKINEKITPLECQVKDILKKTDNGFFVHNFEMFRIYFQLEESVLPPKLEETCETTLGKLPKNFFESLNGRYQEDLVAFTQFLESNGDFLIPKDSVVQMTKPDLQTSLSQVIHTSMKYNSSISGNTSLENFRELVGSSPKRGTHYNDIISGVCIAQDEVSMYYLREGVQNARDALLREDKEKGGTISIDTYSRDGYFTTSISDSVGMELSDVISKLLTPYNSGKDGEIDATGKFGKGFFTFAIGSKELRIKTSTGNGTVQYIQMIPDMKDGIIHDFEVQIESRKEQFKGTTIERVDELSGIQGNLRALIGTNLLKKYVGNVEGVNILYNDHQLNTPSRKHFLRTGSVHEITADKQAGDTNIKISELSKFLGAARASLIKAVLQKGSSEISNNDHIVTSTNKDISIIPSEQFETPPTPSLGTLNIYKSDDGIERFTKDNLWISEVKQDLISDFPDWIQEYIKSQKLSIDIPSDIPLVGSRNSIENKEYYMSIIKPSLYRMIIDIVLSDSIKKSLKIPMMPEDYLSLLKYEKKGGEEIPKIAAKYNSDTSYILSESEIETLKDSAGMAQFLTLVEFGHNGKTTSLRNIKEDIHNNRINADLYGDRFREKIQYSQEHIQSGANKRVKEYNISEKRVSKELGTSVYKIRKFKSKISSVFSQISHDLNGKNLKITFYRKKGGFASSVGGNNELGFNISSDIELKNIIEGIDIPTIWEQIIDIVAHEMTHNEEDKLGTRKWGTHETNETHDESFMKINRAILTQLIRSLA